MMKETKAVYFSFFFSNEAAVTDDTLPHLKRESIETRCQWQHYSATVMTQHKSNVSTKVENKITAELHILTITKGT